MKFCLKQLLRKAPRGVSSLSPSIPCPEKLDPNFVWTYMLSSVWVWLASGSGRGDAGTSFRKGRGKALDGSRLLPSPTSLDPIFSVFFNSPLGQVQGRACLSFLALLCVWECYQWPIFLGGCKFFPMGGSCSASFGCI